MPTSTPGRLTNAMGGMRIAVSNHVPTPIPSVTDAESQLSNLEKRELFATKLRKVKKKQVLKEKRERLQKESRQSQNGNRE